MKRQLITFKRVLVSGSKNFLRNAWLSSAAILVMTITLVMVSFTAIAFQASNLTIKKVAEKIDITLFVKDSVTDADAKRVSEQIKQIEGVTSVEYLDKQTVYNQQVEDAKARKDQIKLSGYELSGIDGVYSTIKVKTDDPKNLTPIKDQLGKKEYADILDQTNSESSAKQNETINNVTRIASFMRKFGLIISLIFVVISVILIFNTIRMTIFNRKDEIEIMRLIGASVWYIRGPFLVEASLYAFVASIFTMGITYGSIKNSSKLSSFIEIIPVADFIKEYWWLCLLLILVAGIFIGVFSASLAIRKYIRFKVY
jgi:cell division transport system permease protein